MNGKNYLPTCMLMDRFHVNRGVSDWPLKLVLFLFYPFGAFLYSLLRNPASKSSYCVYWGVGILFCWSIYYSPHNFFYIDFILTVERFYETHLTFGQFIEEFKKTLTLSSNAYPDFYNLFIYCLTGSISDNFHLMYVIAGIPCLYCMLNSLKYITNDEKFKPTIYGYIFMLLFILPRSLFHIQNFRYFTAFWICVYCSLCYFHTGSRKYLYFFLVLPFIHYSFWLMIICFILYFLLKKRPVLMKYLFYISIPFALFPVDLFKEFVSPDLIPSFLSSKSDLYLSDNMNEKLGMYANGVRSIFKALNVMILIFSTCYMMRRIEKQKVSLNIYSFFYFYMICLSVFGFLNVLPILGERFFLLGRTFCVFLWFILVFPKCKKWVYCFMAGAALDIYTDVGLYLKVLSLDFFYSNLMDLFTKNIGVTFYN